MPTAGGVAIQGCAVRVCQLAADGSPQSGFALWVDDKPLVSMTLKPAVEVGQDVVVKTPTGVPQVSFKQYDKVKWWTAQLTIGDFDFQKVETLGGGGVIADPGDSGRTLTSGSLTAGSNVLTDASSSFSRVDVGREVTVAGYSGFIERIIDPNHALLSAASTVTIGPSTVTLAGLPLAYVAYQWPKLMDPANTTGVSVEIWQKMIVRGTGYQGTTPYPSAGRPAAAPDPGLPPSAYARFGVFKFLPRHDGFDVKNDASQQVFTGWCVPNPNFGLGPAGDWTTTGLVGGTPLDTTSVLMAMMDFQLPAGLGVGPPPPPPPSGHTWDDLSALFVQWLDIDTAFPTWDDTSF